MVGAREGWARHRRMAMSNEQRDELNLAIHEYLAAAGYEATAASLVVEVSVEFRLVLVILCAHTCLPLVHSRLAHYLFRGPTTPPLMHQTDGHFFFSSWMCIYLSGV